MERNSLAGRIYFLTHPLMPGYVNIGKTVMKPHERLRHYNAGDPLKRFEFKFIINVENVAHAERAAHLCLRRCRVGRSEWFKLDAIKAFGIVSSRLASDADRRTQLESAAAAKVRHSKPVRGGR